MWIYTSGEWGAGFEPASSVSNDTCSTIWANPPEDLRDYLYVSNVVIFIHMYLTLVILLFIRTYQSQTLVKVLWLDLGMTRQVLSRALIFTIYSSLLLIGGRASGAEKLSPVFASLRGRGRIQCGGTLLWLLFSTERLCVRGESSAYESKRNKREGRVK